LPQGLQTVTCLTAQALTTDLQPQAQPRAHTDIILEKRRHSGHCTGTPGHLLVILLPGLLASLALHVERYVVPVASVQRYAELLGQHSKRVSVHPGDDAAPHVGTGYVLLAIMLGLQQMTRGAVADHCGIERVSVARWCRLQLSTACAAPTKQARAHAIPHFMLCAHPDTTTAVHGPCCFSNYLQHPGSLTALCSNLCSSSTASSAQQHKITHVYFNLKSCPIESRTSIFREYTRPPIRSLPSSTSTL